MLSATIPGTNFAAGFTNTESVLGEPSRVNPFEDSTDPFDPPYGKNQILSLGEGGSVVVKFNRVVINRPHKLFGLDFIIFGNSGFVITNGDYSGGGITDGSLLGNNLGATRVSVSRDGVHYFVLDTNVALTVDGLFPTDGAGDFRVPVNPEVSENEFAGATLDDIRALYAGSGGGTGYNISWARNRRGRKVHLLHIRYVRVEVLGGRSEIDGFAATAHVVHHAK